MNVIGKFCYILIIILASSCATSFQDPALDVPKQAIPKLPIHNIKIKEKIKIAVLLPLSGKHKKLGDAMLNSITLSLFENDRRNDIEIVIFDNEGSSSESLKQVKEIAKQNIKIIVGPIFSTSVEAIASFIQKNQMTALSFSNNQDLSGKEGIFLMGFLPEQQAERLAGYVISQGKSDFSIIAPSNRYGLAFSSIFKDMVHKKDGNFITSATYLNNALDLERTVQRVINAYKVSPRAYENLEENENRAQTLIAEEFKIYSNVILIPESGKSLSQIVSLINKYNVSEREIKIIGSSNWDNMSTLSDPNLIDSWFVAPDSDWFNDFKRRYEKTYNKPPLRISSIGYDVILAISEVIKQSKDKVINTQSLVNYQSLINGFMGIDGPFRFLPNGLTQRNFAIIKVENGKFKTIDQPSRGFFKY